MKSAQQIQQEGTGLYHLTKKDAGEAYRAARKVKVEFTSFFTRKRGKGSK
jgi:hypothetical protein